MIRLAQGMQLSFVEGSRVAAGLQMVGETPTGGEIYISCKCYLHLKLLIILIQQIIK